MIAARAPSVQRASNARRRLVPGARTLRIRLQRANRPFRRPNRRPLYRFVLYFDPDWTKASTTNSLAPGDHLPGDQRPDRTRTDLRRCRRLRPGADRESYARRPHPRTPTQRRTPATSSQPSTAPSPRPRQASTPGLPRNSCQNRRRRTWIRIVRNGRAAERTHEMASWSADKNRHDARDTECPGHVAGNVRTHEVGAGRTYRNGRKWKVNNRPWMSMWTTSTPLWQDKRPHSRSPRLQDGAKIAKGSQEISSRSCHQRNRET